MHNIKPKLVPRGTSGLFAIIATLTIIMANDFHNQVRQTLADAVQLSVSAPLPDHCQLPMKCTTSSALVVMLSRHHVTWFAG